MEQEFLTWLQARKSQLEEEGRTSEEISRIIANLLKLKMEGTDPRDEEALMKSLLPKLEEKAKVTETDVSKAKIKALGKITEAITKESSQTTTLDRLISENLRLKSELLEQNAKLAKQLIEDRIRERENYRKGLEAFFGNLFEILTSFADSQTEQGLVLIFSRQGSQISLVESLASKKALVKGDVKVEGVD